MSEFTGGQDCYVTSCATAGIAIAVAAAVSHGEPDRVAQLPDSSGMTNEVVMLRGHNVDFGASIMSAIRLSGGRIVEVRHSNLAYLWQLGKAITPQTAVDCRCGGGRGPAALYGGRGRYGDLQRGK